MLIAELLLWISAAATIALGVGVPSFLWLAARLARKPIPSTQGSSPRPAVTILMTAFCAEEGILERLRRILDTDYPADQLELILLCGVEGELTAEVARTLEDPRLRVIQGRPGIPTHRALESAVDSARGDLVICVEPDIQLSRSAIGRIVQRFHDPAIGMVCVKIGEGFDARETDSRPPGGIASWLSAQESAIDAFLPVSPVLPAARRTLWRFTPGTPFVEPIVTADNVRRQGFRVEFLEADLATHAGGEREAARFGWHAWQCHGHRLDHLLRKAPWLWKFWTRRDIALFWLRRVGLWICPVLMLMALAANCSLCNDPAYLRLLLIHEGIYLVALLIAQRRLKRSGRYPQDVVLTGEFSGLSLRRSMNRDRLAGPTIGGLS